jgi:hypothetical protein
VNTQITFKHMTGSRKEIAGIADVDRAPRLVSREQFSSEIGKNIAMFQRDESHVVKVILVNEEYEPLEDTLNELPKAAKERIEQNRTDEFMARKSANNNIRMALRKLAEDNQIELLGESEITPEEVLKNAKSVVNLSAIAIADYEDRGIPVPPDLVPSKNPEVERAAKAVLENKAKLVEKTK